MRAVILVGGASARISEESHLRVKPLIHLGGSPILWWIVGIVSADHTGIRNLPGIQGLFNREAVLRLSRAPGERHAQRLSQQNRRSPESRAAEGDSARHWIGGGIRQAPAENYRVPGGRTLLHHLRGWHLWRRVGALSLVALPTRDGDSESFDSSLRGAGTRRHARAPVRRETLRRWTVNQQRWLHPEVETLPVFRRDQDVGEQETAPRLAAGPDCNLLPRSLLGSDGTPCVTRLTLGERGAPKCAPGGPSIDYTVKRRGNSCGY